MIKIFVFLIVPIICAFSTDFTDCGSQYSIKEVVLDGCDGNNCILRTGINASLSLTALSGFESEKISSQIYVLISGFKFKLTVFPSDPCQAIKCPVRSNSNLLYNASFYVDPSLAWHEVVPLVVKLEDQKYGTTRPIVCIQINVEIPES